MLPAPWSVRRVSRETADTFTLELVPAAEGPAFAFLPGQFNMLDVFGVGEVPISISGDAGRPGVLVHTTRAVGPVTRAMVKLRRDEWLGVRGPFGVPWPVAEAEGGDVLLVAGGIGLAPLRPVVYHLLAHRRRFGRVALLYGTRSPGDILYPRELERWRSRFDLQVEITVDRAGREWLGNVGLVTALLPRVRLDPQGTVALLCGPEIMMRLTAAELQRRGLHPQRIHLSLERNMKCGVGLCGHCQLGPLLVCRDGPVIAAAMAGGWLERREV